MSSPRSLQGKTAIVTGASRGIGTAIATNLASKGCNLILNFTSPSSESKCADLAVELKSKHGVTAVPVQADMGSPDCGAKLVAETLKAFGSEKSGNLTIDIVINNAGVSNNLGVQDVTVDDFDKQYHVNVRGPLLLVQAALPYLPTDRSGRIINVSSVSASIGYPGQSVYGGTKAALECMTRTWSRELNARATVNSINPGPVSTDMYNSVPEEFAMGNAPWLTNAPMSQVDEVRDGSEAVRRYSKFGGRPATPQEIAGVVGMLCAAESQFCTGSVVCANGGMVMSRA